MWLLSEDSGSLIVSCIWCNPTSPHFCGHLVELLPKHSPCPCSKWVNRSLEASAPTKTFALACTFQALIWCSCYSHIWFFFLFYSLAIQKLARFSFLRFLFLFFCCSLVIKKLGKFLISSLLLLLLRCCSIANASKSLSSFVAWKLTFSICHRHLQMVINHVAVSSGLRLLQESAGSAAAAELVA